MEGGDALEQAPFPEIRDPSEKIPVPTGLRYLVCYEFLQRCSWKGPQVVLVLFLFEHFRLSENLSTELVHIFLFIMYISPVLGAVLSDGYLVSILCIVSLKSPDTSTAYLVSLCIGTAAIPVLQGAYHTLLCCSFLQLGGMVILVLGAAPSAETGWKVMMVTVSAFGLLLGAVAVGGQKPTLPAFGGDQIEVLTPNKADKDRLRTFFFSRFYIAMNGGSILATIVIPPLRIFGSHSYGLIFSVETVVLAVAILVFWCGRRHYAHRRVSENIFVKAGKIIVDAVRFRMKSQNPLQSAANDDETKHLLSENGDIVENIGRQDITATGDAEAQHWLDGAKLKHDATSVEDVKLLFRVLTLFTAFPMFWALFQQQYTKWILQARSMNLEVSWLGGLVLQPDQIQGLNPTLAIIIIPILDHGLYPLFTKLNVPLPPLRKMVIGLGCGALAFLASGVVQLAMDRSLERTSNPAKISVFWQVPQYFFVTMGEVMISITGLDFAYSQAPSSMKSLLQCAWSLTAAFGNLLTLVIIALVGDRLSQANEFFLFAGGCAAAMFLTIWISHGYDDNHITVPDNSDPVHAETTYVTMNE